MRRGEATCKSEGRKVVRRSRGQRRATVRSGRAPFLARGLVAGRGLRPSSGASVLRAATTGNKFIAFVAIKPVAGLACVSPLPLGIAPRAAWIARGGGGGGFDGSAAHETHATRRSPFESPPRNPLNLTTPDAWKRRRLSQFGKLRRYSGKLEGSAAARTSNSGLGR
ncbi:hypothetical protein E2C01_092406 [Portunus trituberculatus]|uniref:Uncharacterized protein n=1 Tax=Portunus trituberculatus TaxID=210409 RepID=A0A5B7JRM8_PORTR|nr:hypothetical protein [Portunus trituberculatus]